MTGTSVMKELNVHNSKAGKILRNQLERNNSRQHFRSNEDKFMFRLFVIMLTKIWKYLFSPMLLIKIASTIRDHSFSTCAKFPENLTFLNPWYAPYFSRKVWWVVRIGSFCPKLTYCTDQNGPKGGLHENEFWPFSNTKMNATNTEKVDEKNGVICLASMFPSWGMVRKLSKKSAFFTILYWSQREIWVC